MRSTRDRRSSRPAGARSRRRRARAILAFQIAMLEDDDLDRAGARADRGRRRPPMPAWSAGARPEIADYEAADDDYFRAPRRRSERSARPRAARISPAKPISVVPAGVDPHRRRPAAEPLPGDRLERGRRSCSRRAARPAMSPCSRARAAFRWWSASARSTSMTAMEAIVDGDAGILIVDPDARERGPAIARRRGRTGGGARGAMASFDGPAVPPTACRSRS